MTKYRGRIAPNYYADLTLYNPDTVADLATFDDPHRFANGIEMVLEQIARVVA